jgi:hypothetical protein
MKRIIEARASDKRLRTGSRRRHGHGGRIEYPAYTGLAREMRATLQQIAQELGQWGEKHELTGKEGEPLQSKADLSMLSDEELETFTRLVRKCSDPYRYADARARKFRKLIFERKWDGIDAGVGLGNRSTGPWRPTAS